MKKIRKHFSKAFKEKQRLGFVRSLAMKRRPTKGERAMKAILDEAGIFYRFQSYFIADDRLYIPDFILSCPRYKLVLEVDGKNHKNQKHYDELRTKWMEAKRNCRVLRFTNEQVEIEKATVLEIIQKHNPMKRHEHDMDVLMNMAWFRTPPITGVRQVLY